jgi:hypothetical protein
MLDTRAFGWLYHMSSGGASNTQLLGATPKKAKAIPAEAGWPALP